MKAILTFLLCCVMSFMSEPLTKLNSEIYFADGYNGATFSESYSETISYSQKEESQSYINGGIPTYYDTSGREKTCANVAGSIVLGYYDKTYDEIIADFTSARVIRDKVLFNVQNEAVQGVMDKLYVYMGTNSTSNGGTTVPGFKNGLSSYVTEKGRSITYETIKSNNVFDKIKYTDAINSGNPVVLFMSKYSLVAIKDFSVSDTQDKIDISLFTGNHVLIGYGIKEITYYDVSGNVSRQLIFLMAATGYKQDALSYILLDDYGTIYEGYKINIY